VTGTAQFRCGQLPKSSQVQFSDPEVEEFKRWFTKWKRAGDDGPNYG
jgi:hypothetical protein